MVYPTSVPSDLQVRKVTITFSILSANTLLTVSDEKYWFRLLNKDLHTVEQVENFAPTLMYSTQRK